MKRIAWVVAAIVLLAGCGETGPGLQQPTQALIRSTDTLTPSPTLAPAVTSTPISPPLTPTPAGAAGVETARNMVGLVVADLAEHEGVATDEIDVWMVEAVSWPGGQLECQPVDQVDGESLPGYRISLLIGSTRYIYHTDSRARFVLCPVEESAPAGDLIILDTQVQALVELARAHLARRLDLPVRRIFVVDAYPVDWPDARLGCLLSDEQVPPTPVSGYRIVLQAGETTYVYHSDYRQVVYCPAEAIQVTATPLATAVGVSPDQG
ncbi:MAG: hypothetical protein HPY64_12430 [Anaerolineae bacterium]|nr:hypothetical protein [Anaerolineae bacterium]